MPLKIETSLRIEPVQSLFVLFSYTFIESDTRRELDYISKYALDHLKHQSSIRITYGLPFGIQTLAAVTYKERIGEDDYILLDMRVAKGFPIGEFYITVTNISDKDYQEISGAPMPGRWIQGGIKLSF